MTRRWEGGFEPSVPLLRNALLGIADRDVRVSGFDIAMMAWLGFPRPFRSRWDREFEAAFLQQRVMYEPAIALLGRMN
jgi:hypothetical protein